MHPISLLTTRGARVTAAATILGTLSATAIGAQALSIPFNDPAVKRAMDAMQPLQAWTLDQQVSICEIPAPPFKEQARAAEFKKRMIGFGYADTRIDAEGNVIAELGRGDGPTVVLAGHLDTVFPEGTDVRTTRTGEKVAGPGIGDDCRGLAVVLTVAKVLKEQNIVPKGKLILVANVGEEGPGNLRGVRHLFTKEYVSKIDYFISVDGAGGGAITSRAVGSHRYTVTFEGPGGHSYGAFGMTNPMHAMGRAIANIADIPVPMRPRTTFNVGVVRGGTSVNTITPMAQMEVDMRSESAEELTKIDKAIREAIEKGAAAERARWPNSRAPITVKYDTIGIRPTGGQSDDAPIVQTAWKAVEMVGWLPATVASSTDANLPIAMGIPAITINGGGRSTGAHGTEEAYFEMADSYKGPQLALLIVTALAGLGR